jgi:rubredoxin
MINPHWLQFIYATVKATRRCPHCDRRGVYLTKKPGQFYVCKFCHHRFQEKKEPANAT